MRFWIPKNYNDNSTAPNNTVTDASDKPDKVNYVQSQSEMGKNFGEVPRVNEVLGSNTGSIQVCKVNTDNSTKKGDLMLKYSKNLTENMARGDSQCPVPNLFEGEINNSVYKIPDTTDLIIAGNKSSFGAKIQLNQNFASLSKGEVSSATTNSAKPGFLNLSSGESQAADIPDTTPNYGQANRNGIW